MIKLSVLNKVNVETYFRLIQNYCVHENMFADSILSPEVRF